MQGIHPDVSRVLFTEEQIAQRVAEMGAQITADYKGETLLVVSVLRGAVIFTADLVRTIDLPVEMDFMAVSSYGSAAKSSGELKILKDTSSAIEGRHVLIVEDVLDSGLTLELLVEILKQRNPLSVEVATLLRKQVEPQAPVKCRYIGFECPDEFIVGYGLDFAERYRSLPYIGALKPEVYE